MTVTKANADVLDLTDAYAFSGTVTGTPAGGLEFVSAVTASSSASVSFTGLETGYDYLITATAVLPASDNVAFVCNLGVTGPTYRTSGYVGLTSNQSGPGNGTNIASFTTHIDISPTAQGNVADESMLFDLTIYDPAASTDTYFQGTGQDHQNGTVFHNHSTGGHYTTAEAHTAIKFTYASGNIATGFFKLYRRTNA